MKRSPLILLSAIVAAMAMFGATAPLGASSDSVKESTATAGPLAPQDLRLDPLYDTVLVWDQERNPPFHVFEWQVFRDGKLQTSLRTTRYNMPVGARSGTYTVLAVTRDGLASPASLPFTVGKTAPPSTEPPTTKPPTTKPPTTTPPTTDPLAPIEGPLAPQNLRLDPKYDTVLVWDQERNAPFYVYEWQVFRNGKLQTSLRTTRYNMPVGARSGTYTVLAVTRDGVASPASLPFTVGGTAPTTTEPPTTEPPTTEPPTTEPPTTEPPTTEPPTTQPPTTEPPTTEPPTTEPPTTEPPTTEPPTTDSDDLVWGYDATPPATDRAETPLNVVVTDPVYGTDVRRRTDATGTRFDRNTYSRRQAENADGTYYLTYHGNSTYRVYSRASNELVSETDIHPNGEPQWHPTNPSLIRHVGGNNSSVGDLRVRETNVVTGETTIVADLTSRLRAQLPDADYMIDRAEGSPSMDGDRYAWMVYDDSESPVGIVSYDLGSDRILGLVDGLQENRFGALDWVSMSPTGTYAIAGYGQGTIVYDADLSNERLINDKADHSDIALNADGDDAYVYIDFSSGPDAGFLVSVDLDTLDRTRIFEIYGGANTSVHISGKGYEKPGWVLVSTYNCRDAGAWTCDKVMAVEMAENGRVLNLAHTYNCGDNYWTETHAVVNRDFTRAYYNTDSGSCGTDAEVMELTIPAFDTGGSR